MGSFITRQLILMLIIVILMTTIMPSRVCMFVCSYWVDMIILLMMGSVLVFIMTSSRIARTWRLVAFYGLGVLASYIIGIQYNIMKIVSNHRRLTSINFILSFMITVIGVIGTITILPYLMSHLNFFKNLEMILTMAMFIIIVWGLFTQSRNTMLPWIVAALVVFIAFFISDTVVLVSSCLTTMTNQGQQLNY